MRRTQHACQVCGEKFLGGPSSKYCFDCKREKMLESNRKAARKRRANAKKNN